VAEQPEQAAPLREQRLVFGEVADAYDRRRPTYPQPLVDAVLDYSGLAGDTTTPVVEVGAGTGKASILFAARGVRLTCVEPSPAMATIARSNLAEFDNVAVVQTSFEDWKPEPHSYGLVFAAQSWHWMTPEIRTAKAHQVLRPSGSIALFWNVIANRGGEGLDRDLSAAYGDLMPNGMWRSVPTDRVQANNWVIEELEGSGLFGPVTVVREPWHATYDSDEWLELLSTQSDHRMLDEGARDALFDRIREAVDANGGNVEVEYLSVGYLAQTRNSAE
jgi:SAM-dependent methyltransferase